MEALEDPFVSYGGLVYYESVHSHIKLGSHALWATHVLW